MWNKLLQVKHLFTKHDEITFTGIYRFESSTGEKWSIEKPIWRCRCGIWFEPELGD